MISVLELNLFIVLRTKSLEGRDIWAVRKLSDITKYSDYSYIAVSTTTSTETERF